MTSDEIKQFPLNQYELTDAERLHAILQREIAYQLAILNEKAPAEEVTSLRERVDRLLKANNAEVEQRRHAQGKLEAAEKHIELLTADRNRQAETIQRLAERSEPKRDAVGERDPKPKRIVSLAAGQNPGDIFSFNLADGGRVHIPPDQVRRMWNAEQVAKSAESPRESTVEDLHG